MSQDMPAIFLSSTARDLAKQREAVCSAIHRDGRYRCICMEYFGAKDATPADYCRKRLAESSLFVGIVGHLYGSLVPDGDYSFTEMEYRTAVYIGMPRLLFLAPDDFPLTGNLRESDALYEKQQAFRKTVMRERVCDEFGSNDDLARRVMQAVRDWEAHGASTPPSPPSPPSPPGDFEHQVGAWLEKLEYRFETHGAWTGGWFQWILGEPSPRSQNRVLVRCGQHEVHLEDVASLKHAARDAGANTAWIVVPRRIAPAALNAADRSDRPKLVCWTFDELIDQHADFSNYFNWLEAEVQRLGIERHFVPLACIQNEPDPETGELTERSRYDWEKGGLEHYVDLWLDDPAKEHVSILGGFGTGKTWFALHYAYKLIQQYRTAQEQGLSRPRVPLYIPLRDYAKAVTTTSLLSEFFFKKHEIPIRGYSLFEQLNRMGRLLLIFDGFDEMASRVDHQSIVNNFWELAQVVASGAKAVLTCRNEHFPEAVQGRNLLRGELRSATTQMLVDAPRFEVVEIELFDERQIRAVLENHGAPGSVINRILANKDLADLVRRPLLVEFVIEALPEISVNSQVDTAHIFAVAIRRKMQRDIGENKTFTSMADKLYFMSEISWEMLRDDRMSLHYKEFPDRLNRLFGPDVEHQKDLDNWWFDMMNQSLLVRNASGEYSPAHRSLAEFFAAYKMVAELGVLSPDFLDLVNRPDHQIAPDLPARQYRWTEYFLRSVDSYGQLRPNARISGFAPELNDDGDGESSAVRFSRLPSNAQIFAAGMVAKDSATIQRLSEIALSGSNFFSWNALLLFPLLREEFGPVLAQTIVGASKGKPLPPGWPWVLGELEYTGKEVYNALELTVKAYALGEKVDSIAWWHAAFALKKLGWFGEGQERNDEAVIAYLAKNRPSGCSLEEAKQLVSKSLDATDLKNARLSELAVVTIAAERDRVSASELYVNLLGKADFANDALGERRCYYVVWLCGYLKIKESVSDLIQATHHSNSSVRGCAAEALGKIGEASSEVIEALVNVLSDRYYRARYHAAESLELLSAVEAIDDLTLAIRREELRSIRERMELTRKALAEMNSDDKSSI